MDIWKSIALYCLIILLSGPGTFAFAKDVDDNGFTKEDHKWWAIQAVTDPEIPTTSGKGWAKNAIDHFIARKLKENKLSPAKEASANELVRRIYFDLHGLPPTPEQVKTFTTAYKKDPEPALENLIDELLASPRYGERWAQHWLDVVRYAESDGYNSDGYRPDSWRFRDYVIDSINEDKPYDQFVKEQLAADEFAADDPKTLIATAFLRLGIYEWNQRNARMQWELIMTEMTNVTSEAFLGLGMGCAQCHDHKFDPILQKDYFALQAFLNTTWWPESRPLATPAERAAYDRKMAEWEAATKKIRAELDDLTRVYYENKKKSVVIQFPADVQEMYAKPAEQRSAYEEQIAQLVQRQVDYGFDKIDFVKLLAKNKEKLPKYKELTKKLKAFDHLKPKALPMAFVSTDVGTKGATTFYKERKKKTAVEPAFLTLMGLPAPEIKPTENTTGRRTALANWIADKDNPLSTRVIVNRIWQRHFGSGIVETPNDFGRLGEEPSQPELLDWLTKRFLENGWKMKPLHRLIMTSATYRQTARTEPGTTEMMTDPRNRLLWRFSPGRLDAEQVRDSMLVTSGELENRDGGPSVDGKEPNRSIYVKKKRNTKDPMIGQFDAPTGFSSAPNRIPTTTPNQSLMLINGGWTLTRAGAFAKRVLAGKQSVDSDVIRRAYRIAYSREATDAEIGAALAFVESQSGTVSAPAPPAPKYPNETGLRPVSQVFKNIKGLGLGEKALWLQPGSRFQQLQINEAELPDDEFTIEAVVNIDSVHPDAAVNTLISRWHESKKDIGWTFGVTSAKSRYRPRNLIIQLVGDDFQHQRIYEVVASDLHLPLGKPYYLAAAISAKASKDDVTKGIINFYVKDLSDPNAPLLTASVPHQIVGGLDSKSSLQTLIGGRHQGNHLWDGQLARIVVSDGVLSTGQLLINGGKGKHRVIDWNFSGKNGEHPAPKTAWIRKTSKTSPAEYPPQLIGAMTDFCHALLNSNEFLYLH